VVTDRQNFWLHVSEGAFCSFGMMVVGGQLVMPGLIRELGGSPHIIGVMGSVFGLSTFVQFLSVRFFERIKSKKWIVQIFGLGMRLPDLLIALALMKWGPTPEMRRFALAAIVASKAVGSFSSALLVPAWMDMLGDTIPQRWHGHYFGYRGAITNVAGCVAGLLIYRWLAWVEFPANFFTMFLFAFGMTMTSWVIYLFVNDTPEEAASRKEVRHEPVIEYVMTIPRLLGGDVAFRRFSVFSTLNFTAMSVMIFSGNAALERFGLDVKNVGYFMTVSFACQLICCLTFPRIAQRIGHRANLVISSLCMVACCAFAAFAPTPGLYYGSFVFWGLSMGISRVSFMSYLLEQAPPETRMRYLSALSVVRAPVRMMGPIAAGAAVVWLGDYVWIFAAAGGVHLLGAIAALRLPRRSAPPADAGQAR